MGNVPEPLQSQLAQAARHRRARERMPAVLGMLAGGVFVLFLGALCNVFGIHVRHRLAAVVVGAIVGVLGPVVIDQAVGRRPERFGFEPENLD